MNSYFCLLLKARYKRKCSVLLACLLILPLTPYVFHSFSCYNPLFKWCILVNTMQNCYFQFQDVNILKFEIVVYTLKVATSWGWHTSLVSRKNKARVIYQLFLQNFLYLFWDMCGTNQHHADVINISKRCEIFTLYLINAYGGKNGGKILSI